MKYLFHNIQRCSANIEFFREQPNSVIVQGKIHKYSTENIGKFFIESVLSKKRHLSFCYIIQDNATIMQITQKFNNANNCYLRLAILRFLLIFLCHFPLSTGLFFKCKPPNKNLLFVGSNYFSWLSYV